MLHIILYILKTIGIILLVIIGLLLLMLVSIMFVPIRYKLNVSSKDGNVYFNGRVSWLLHLIHVAVKKDTKDPRIWIRLLGIKIFDSSKKKKQKKEAKKKQKKEFKKEPKKEKKNDVRQKDYKETKPNIRDEFKSRDFDSDKTESYIEGENSYEKKPSFMGKIKYKIKKIKDKIINAIKKLCNIRQKIKIVVDFVKDEINKEGFKTIYGSLKKLLKHLMPTELNLQLLFGTGDPCSTGQALGVLSILYSLYGQHIEITPDFENEVVEGKLDAKGRIRLFTVIMIVIKLICDKKFKRLKNNFNALKEAL